MSETKNVEIKCPECGMNNTIDLPLDHKCQKCSAALISGKNTKKKISALSAALIAGLGTHQLYQHLNDRYPMTHEYIIIDACINESSRPMKLTRLLKKGKICICALEKTQTDFDKNAYFNEDNKNAFINAFEANADQCKDE